MHLAYDSWPKLARESYENSDNKIDYKNINHIIFAGMGGSGAAGEILKGVLSKSDIHFTIVKGYYLPNPVDSGTLVLAASISGNTEETLAVVKNAFKKNLKIASFSSGGLLQDFCVKHNLLHQKFTMINSPRASLPMLLYTVVSVLGDTLHIKKSDIIESIRKLEQTKKNISSHNVSDKNPSLSLGSWITNMPIIYYPYGLYPAAIRFKNSLHENCKLHATAEDVVEACHNNIVSWERKSVLQPVLIRGRDDYDKTKERWKIIRSFFKEKNIDYKEILSVNGSIFSKLINLVYLLDYATIYHAVLNKIDPTPIKSIDYVKSKLASPV